MWFDRRRCGYDRKAVQSVEACEKFRAMLQQAPCVDLSVDVDSHLALQNAYILHAARQCFASQCKPRKKAWISEHSLELVRQKRTAVRVWTDLQRKWRWSVLKRVYEVWKAVQNGKNAIFILQMHQARMCALRSIIANERKMARLGVELKKSLADDKIRHIHSIVNAAFIERASGDDRAFWKGVRALRNRGSCGARTIALENGELAPTPYAGRQRWQRHFAKLLCGEILPSSECVAAARQEYNARQNVVEPEADLVPTLSEVIARFSRLRTGKALGEDHLGGELSHTFPHELARILHPVFAKAALRSCEPWLWRGSLVHELPKKGKNLKLCDAYRDIALACEAGKVYHGILRTRLVPEYWSFCSQAEYGGVRHRGCDFGNLAGRSFMMIAKARGWSCAVVYFDAVTAFASMLRALVCQQSSRDCPTHEALLATGFSPDEIAAMSHEARQAPVCDIMLKSPHLRRLLSDTLSNTWAAAQGVKEVAATRRGSKAGEPLADLAFGMLMRRILERVRERMDEKGIVARLPVCGATPFATVDEVIPEMEAVHDISYVDDASAYTWSPDPNTVIDNVKSIVAIYHEEFLRHGMQLNYAAGKSECLVALRGKAAAAAREGVFVRDKARITVESQSGTLLLRVVDAYKHLGGIVTSSGSQSRELQARIKAMNVGVAALNRPVMGRHEIPVEDKLLLCSTLADTRLFLYAGAWTSLSAAQQRALHRARMQILRRATNMYRRSDGGNMTDREVLVAAGCCTIDVQVAMLRLLFFGRLVRWGTAPLFAVLQAGDGQVTSWTTTVRRDLAWLDRSEARGDFYDFSDPHNGDCSDWVAFARDKPAQWKTRVKRAVKKSILSPETFPVSGFLVQPAEMTECADCGKICRGMGGLRAHQFRVHGRRCESRLFALGSVCRWCMTDFRTRPRLIVHFRKCPACVVGMRMYGMSTLGPEEMEELGIADRALAASMKRQGRSFVDAASEPAHSVRTELVGSP